MRKKKQVAPPKEKMGTCTRCGNKKGEPKDPRVPRHLTRVGGGRDVLYGYICDSCWPKYSRLMNDFAICAALSKEEDENNA